MGINIDKWKSGGRWCVLIPPGAEGRDGVKSVELFGFRTRSKAEARRKAREWNSPPSWRPVVRRYSRRFREACGETPISEMPEIDEKEAEEVRQRVRDHFNREKEEN